ncbi:carbohydrate ABC transporter permease [Proteiniclasticum ruminis]|uniref:Raffinose/stachyose/melibiose transport system permease protein n=1 Tax=Proteiniclasticum ruminis TaxID=398199 RepID=A0A1G8JJE9_9CLOT|nr:carbohydrate ABC transporter permease [Proteiniclasticum ruminis]SDI31338.1 raffinose/stachyose/melibiose transport system permease protein [Proteiniclasticum ruminis]
MREQFKESSRKVKWSPGVIFTHVLLITGAVLVIYPLLWMVVSSMKSYNEIYNDVWGFPAKWLVENYQTAWSKGISAYFLNSVIVTGATVVSVVIIASMAAYALSRYRTRLIDVALVFIMAGMMINPQVALIPLHGILTDMNLLNTRFALILPYIAFRLPLSVLLLRSYFLSIPREIQESAIVDGCSELGIYLKIYLPMSKPILLTTVVLTSFYAWNEFLFATIFIDSDSLKTIPSGLMNFRDALRTDWGVLLAGMVIATLPMIILLILLQKHLVRGLSEGSVKG